MNTKIKKSVRLNEYNHEMIRSVADILFNGNYSEALDFILRIVRNDSNFSGLLKYLTYKGRFDRGERSTEVVHGVREFERMLNVIINLTEK